MSDNIRVNDVVLHRHSFAGNREMRYVAASLLGLMIILGAASAGAEPLAAVVIDRFENVDAAARAALDAAKVLREPLAERTLTDPPLQRLQAGFAVTVNHPRYKSY